MAKETEKQLTTAPAAEMDFPALNTLPDLAECEVAPAELLGEYWSPVDTGETKRVFFAGFGKQNTIDRQTGEDIELNIVKFVEKQGNDFRTIRNGSARLYGVFEQMARDLKPGMPFEIKYLGKKRTTTGNSADNWSVRPIILK